MSDEHSPFPASIQVDTQIFTDVIHVLVSEPGVLQITDSSGWCAFFAPGSWGKVIRQERLGTPEGTDPRNLSS